jgi:2Fe-2S ferredoxin
VTFVHADGRRETHAAEVGRSLLDVALDHGVDGLPGRCGGGCACATCHAYVDAAWAGRLPAPADAEREMLEYVHEPRPGSRLCCQVTLTAALDGLVVTVPARQF